MPRLWMTWQRVCDWTLEQAARGLGLLRRRGSEQGASILEVVVLIAIFVAAAILIGGIVVSKATQTANNIKTQ